MLRGCTRRLEGKRALVSEDGIELECVRNENGRIYSTRVILSRGKSELKEID